jgi:hypothetical protein
MSAGQRVLPLAQALAELAALEQPNRLAEADDLATRMLAAMPERAVALDPDFAEAHFEMAEALLLAGRMAEGWESYEWRFRLKQAAGMLPKTDKPQWDGKSLPPGKLLIVGDQGFGDCIQFARLIPWVASLCPAPVLACSRELMTLLAKIPGVTRVITRWDETGDYDAYIPLSGLPRLAGIGTGNVPPAPYMAPDPALVASWEGRLNRLAPPGKRRIALVWAGRPTHKDDRKRTMRLDQFAPLFARDDVVILTVQKGEPIAEVGAYHGHAPLNLGPEIESFADTMSILRHVEVSSPSTPRSRISPAAVACRPFCCCRTRRTGAGCSAATTRPGTARCGCSDRSGPMTGPAWSSGSRLVYRKPLPRRSRPYGQISWSS